LNATQDEAELVADCLVRAEMKGIDTHGVHFLKLLSDRVDAHMIRIPTELKVVREDGTTSFWTEQWTCQVAVIAP